MPQIKVILESATGGPIDNFMVDAMDLTMSLARLPNTAVGLAILVRQHLEDTQFLRVNYDPSKPDEPVKRANKAQSTLDDWLKNG